MQDKGVDIKRYKEASYLLTIFCLFLILTACAKDEQAVDVSKYRPIELAELKNLQPDMALKNDSIKIPQLASNSQWLTSSGLTPGVPQNIAVGQSQPISDQQVFRVHKSFDRDHHFVGNTPVVYGDMLFVLGQACVSAYKLSDLSKTVWKVELRGQSDDFLRGGGLYITDGQLAVTYGSNQVAVLNSETGRELWRYELSSIARSAPLIYKGKVFVMTVDNKVYCFNLRNGLLRWTFEGMADQLVMIRSLSMVAYNDMIIVPCSTSQMLLIKADSGELVQNVSLDSKLSLINQVHAPVIDKGFAYISSYHGSVYALNLKTGSMAWDNPLIGGGALWPAGSYIYTINNYAQLVAAKQSSGRVKWVQNLPYTALSGPILVNNELYVASSDGRLLVFSPPDGRQIKEISIPKGRYASPIAVQGQMFLLADSGKLLELN